MTRRVFFVLVLLLAGTLAWRLLPSQETPRSAVMPESEEEPEAEASMAPADLIEPQVSAEPRVPVEPPVPLVENSIAKGQQGSSLTEEPVKLTLEGRFVGCSQETEGKQAVLIFFHPERDDLQKVHVLDLQPEWSVPLPDMSGLQTFWLEAVALETPRLVSPRIAVSLPRLPSDLPVVLELFPPAGIEGLVSDETGALIPGASLTLKGPSQSASAETDALASFQLFGSLEGEHRLQVRAEGFLPYDETFNLGPSELLSNWITLKRPMRVAGLIRWPFGAPAEGVSLFLRSKATGEQSTTGEDGRFDFTGGPAMKFILYARFGGESGQDFSGRFELDPTLQDLGALDLVLQRSPTVSGVLVDATGLAAAGVNVTFRAVDNSRVTRDATTRADGTFTVLGLYPGSYRVICKGQGLATVAVEAGRAEPFLELALPLPDPAENEAPPGEAFRIRRDQ